MIKLVVFDWNGVLIADARASASSVSKILQSFGREPIDVKIYRDIFSLPASDMYRSRGFTDEEIRTHGNTIQEMFHKDYEPKVSGIRTRRGARKLLEFLSRRNVECIILSGHTLEGIQAQLKRLRLEKYFSSVLANDIHEAMKKRNKLEKLGAFLAQRPYKKNEVLIIGDSTEETHVGKHLGIHTVGITGGYCSARRVKEAKPDYLIHNLMDMIDIIKRV